MRGGLLERWRAARATAPDAVAAFPEVAADGRHCGERGRGGFVRCDWEEATELIAAATVHAIREHGPDRVGGFTPILAMSPVSFAAGTRFLSPIGGQTTAFYDWYAATARRPRPAAGLHGRPLSVRRPAKARP